MAEVKLKRRLHISLLVTLLCGAHIDPIWLWVGRVSVTTEVLAGAKTDVEGGAVVSMFKEAASMRLGGVSQVARDICSVELRVNCPPEPPEAKVKQLEADCPLLCAPKDNALKSIPGEL